jgi:hypothetical protein
MVGGKILMENYRVLSVDEEDILERVQAAADLAFDRAGLRHLLETPPTLWQRSHY